MADKKPFGLIKFAMAKYMAFIVIQIVLEYEVVFLS